jgi:cytochrome c peroxidase
VNDWSLSGRRAASVAILAGLLQGFLSSSAASADGTLTLQRSAAPGAENTSTILSPLALQEIAQVEAEIDRTEAQAIERLAAPPGNQIQQIELLGKLLLYDKQLSVNRNEACAFCHTPETGVYGSRVRAEPDNGLLSRLGAHAIQ